MAATQSPSPDAQILDLLGSLRQVRGKVRALHTAVQLDLPDLLADGARTVEELARLTDTHSRSLHRLLRALASFGVLTEVAPQRFALGGLGIALQSKAPGGVRATLLMSCSEWHETAWGNLMASLRTGKTAIREVYGMEMFDFLAANPDQRALFNAGMPGNRADFAIAVPTAYDFSGCASIMDVGGGIGTMLTAILNSNQEAHGALLELQDCVSEAEEQFASAGLSERCVVLAGDFFEEIPSGYDAYVLSHVLHDWSDDRCMEILRNCRKAIGLDGKLLIVEAVLPHGDTPHPVKITDLQLMTTIGGIERSREEYAELLSKAGFRLERVIPVTPIKDIVEAIPI